MAPTRRTISRLVGAVLMGQNDDWSLQHRYLSLEPMTELGLGDDEQNLLVPPAAASILRPRMA